MDMKDLECNFNFQLHVCIYNVEINGHYIKNVADKLLDNIVDTFTQENNKICSLFKYGRAIRMEKIYDFKNRIYINNVSFFDIMKEGDTWDITRIVFYPEKLPVDNYPRTLQLLKELSECK